MRAPRPARLGRELAGAAEAQRMARIRFGNLLLGVFETFHEVGTSGEPGFESGWSNVGGGSSTMAFFKDTEGKVHLKGTIKNAAPSGTTVFTLPFGYRPPYDEVQMCLKYTGAQLWIVMATIKTDGRVLIPSGSAYDPVRFDGHTFWTE